MLRHIVSIVRARPAVEFKANRSFSVSPTTLQGVNHYTPNNIEKRFLVWSGKYKTVEEVPAHVSHDVMERCRNKVRIRVANIMMALTVVGCCIMVYSGKQAAKRGESVTKQNLDWHKKYNEQTGETAEAAKTAAETTK